MVRLETTQTIITDGRPARLLLGETSWMSLVPIDSLLTYPFQKMCENVEEEEESLGALRTSREEEQEQVSSVLKTVDVSTSKFCTRRTHSWPTTVI